MLASRQIGLWGYHEVQGISQMVRNPYDTVTDVFHWNCYKAKDKKKKKERKRPPYLSDKSLCSGWAHEEHSSAKCVPVAVQLFDSHCSEQTCDHHVDIRFHLLKGYIHSLLGGPVQEILNTTDIWRKRGRDRECVWLWGDAHISLTVLHSEKDNIEDGAERQRYTCSYGFGRYIFKPSLITLQHILCCSWLVFSPHE